MHVFYFIVTYLHLILYVGRIARSPREIHQVCLNFNLKIVLLLVMCIRVFYTLCYLVNVYSIF